MGGFRLGLENTNEKCLMLLGQINGNLLKIQHAFDCYNSNFSTGVHINEDIALISDEEMAKTRADMIVGGFPCQDYSVARSLRRAWIQGKRVFYFGKLLDLFKTLTLSIFY